MKKKFLICIIASSFVLVTNAQWENVTNGIQYSNGNVYVGPALGTTTKIGRLSVSGNSAELSITNRSVSSFVQTPQNGERWVIYCSGSTNDGKLKFWSGSDKIALTKTGYFGIGTETPSTLLSLGIPIQTRMLSLHDNPSDWYGFGIQPSQMRFQVGSSNARYSFYAGDNTELLTIKGNGNVGINTINPQNSLDVNGTIHTKEVKVDMNGWSDFVFHPTYNLRSLQEVNTYIQQKGHLPEIPTAKEVEENGVNLGEMNAKLLQKIEELTLYVIEQQKQIDELKEKVTGDSKK